MPHSMQWKLLADELFDYPDDLTGLLFDFVKRKESEIEGASDVSI